MSSADSDFDGSLVETRQEPLGRWLSEIPVRSLLASYEVSTQELGRGGFGTVVVGRKRHLPQAVAIKRIHADLKFSASDQRRFVREVQLLAPLQHPNIVRVEDWGRDDAGLYLVMELIDGPNLATLVNQCGGPLSLTQLLDFTAQICRALQWAHQHGIVHRDLKPANLLLDRFGVIKLGDFGLARVDPNVREGLTSSGAVQAFTYAYASPEQLRGDSVVDGRSDLFSLGATLYHLATGRADTSRTFDLEELPEPLTPLLPLLSGLLRPSLAKRMPDVAAVLQVLDEVTRAASPSGADAVAAVATASQISEVVADGSCWKCQRVNGLSQKFCSGCGSGLYEACLATACQAQIRVWDAFCAECGADQASLRRVLQQQTAELCQTVQQQLSQQRFDLARLTLQTAQNLLPTTRLRQLQPELPQLAAAIDRQQQSVQLVLDHSRQLGEACQYSEALQCLQAIPQPLWPEAAVAWRNRESEVQRLREQMSQPALEFSWDELSHWLQQLQHLQPHCSLQRYVGRWLEDYQSAAEGLDRAGRWDEVVTLLSGVPEDERTPVMVQLLQQIEQRVAEVCGAAAELASEGDYVEAVKRLQQLPRGLRPAVLDEYRTTAERVQKLDVQLDEAIGSEQLSLTVQCMETLETLQPGLSHRDHRPGQLLAQLLARCEQMLQQGTLGAAAALLRGIPASMQAERYHELLSKLNQQQQQRRAERALIEPLFPFSEAAARAAQAAWAKHLGSAEEWTNTLGMKFRVIPAGTFLMGSPDGEGSHDERPQHRVTISNPFALGVHTVTQGQWQQLMGNSPWKGQVFVKERSEVAATYVSWVDAVHFCRNLSVSEGVRYRLPREAEWEWACRAGTTTEYSFGDDAGQLNQSAWFRDSRKGHYAHRVGQKAANPFGLCDMHGNVFEWCQDWYDELYYEMSSATDPAGPTSGVSRVLRGGSWSNGSAHLRSADRECSTPDSCNDGLGFRVLCELE